MEIVNQTISFLFSISLFSPPECLNIDGLPCGDASTSLYSGVQKKPAVCPVDSLASALREQLTYDRDSDSLTTSPSSSSLDTCSSQKIFQVFSKSSGNPIHQETSVAGEVREAGEGSGSSFSETEVCNDAEPKIPRSVTEGELRHRIVNSLSHHGVSTEEPLLRDCHLGSSHTELILFTFKVSVPSFGNNNWLILSSFLLWSRIQLEIDVNCNTITQIPAVQLTDDHTHRKCYIPENIQSQTGAHWSYIISLSCSHFNVVFAAQALYFVSINVLQSSHQNQTKLISVSIMQAALDTHCSSTRLMYVNVNIVQVDFRFNNKWQLQ